ncbi:uncharacterized protein LOC131636608 [Vicia villosa]|uniref:uncharacterized protein LOC131636608 n=1 Tax=Vicia villosa TaxID=3911 RepID=UPI00273BBFEE|nr:uncharacterized protein LOC131636608 [Vicia villosa]
MIQIPITHKINHLFNILHPQTSSIVLNVGQLCFLFLALLATFHSIFLLKFRKKTPSISPLIAEYDDYTDDEDETCSISSASSESEDDEEEVEEENRTGEYFRFRGDDGDGGFLSSCRSIGDMFSLSEITNSKSVVKLWDTIGLGLGFGLDDSDCNYDGSIVAVYGTDEKLRASSEVWDTRVRRRIPAVIGEWAPGIGKTVGIVSGGRQKIYVRDDGRCKLTVGDTRNVISPLGYVTESQLDLWWPNSYMLKI